MDRGRTSGDKIRSSVRFAVLEFTSFAAQQQNDWSWAVGARLGYVVTPTLLTYFNGGWTQSHWKQVNWINNDPAAAGLGAFSGLTLASQTRNGWFIGGGTEYSFANSLIPIHGLFWKNEVRFSEFGNNTTNQICTIAAACGAVGVQSLARTHIVEQAATTELVYRFQLDRCWRRQVLIFSLKT